MARPYRTGHPLAGVSGRRSRRRCGTAGCPPASGRTPVPARRRPARTPGRAGPVRVRGPRAGPDADGGAPRRCASAAGEGAVRPGARPAASRARGRARRRTDRRPARRPGRRGPVAVRSGVPGPGRACCSPAGAERPAAASRTRSRTASRPPHRPGVSRWFWFVAPEQLCCADPVSGEPGSRDWPARVTPVGATSRRGPVRHPFGPRAGRTGRRRPCRQEAAAAHVCCPDDARARPPGSPGRPGPPGERRGRPTPNSEREYP